MKNHKIHRDRRVFGKFPGAGCVKPGEAWEEGLKERRRYDEYREERRDELLIRRY